MMMAARKPKRMGRRPLKLNNRRFAQKGNFCLVDFGGFSEPELVGELGAWNARSPKSLPQFW